ncbi:hypothetical protein [Bizionia arctica]|uniref:Uncharacterized protein n=1 Tax=Bizionia arctica TaxID=1495645 RepID=A0A917GK68_9FLAO|nr:hypothetical protein [Bizionia arctica]GGG49408.1 hypothetical protein GCM10010976_20910 [Bizionia arctica]
MNKNSENLLDGNLKNMYQLTKEWIDEVEFYIIELKFFNSLISEHISSTTTDDLEHKEIYRNIDELLFKLSNDLISQFKTHKKEIIVLVDTKNLTENSKECIEHIHLLEKMTKLKQGIKKLKKALFRYLKNHPFEFDFDTIY